MKIALFVTFYKQYAEWPYFLAGLKGQTVKPNELHLGIDSFDQKCPDLQGLPFSVVRPYGKPKGHSGRGICINKAAAITNADVMFTTDADCILNPYLIERYKAIFEGKIKNWNYTVHRPGGEPYTADHKVIGATTQIFVGPRFFIPKAAELPDVSAYTWEAFDKLSTHDYHGMRGRPNHTAKIMGCNMAFFMRAMKFARFPTRRGQDTNWWLALQKAKPGVYSLRAAPDNCYVLHMGPNRTGQYW